MPTATACAALLDRLALKLDRAHALLEALPPVEPTELQALYAEAEAALASWGPPPGWEDWEPD
ncbi:MAG: hypothetical protein RLZZ468_973 [Cyanobacteriota bacterium]